MPARTAFELARMAGYQCCISGHVEEGRLALHDALRHTGETMPASPARALWPVAIARYCGSGHAAWRSRTGERCDAVAERIDAVWSAATGLSQIDPITAAALQARNLLLSLRAGEPFRVASAGPPRPSAARSKARDETSASMPC